MIKHLASLLVASLVFSVLAACQSTAPSVAPATAAVDVGVAPGSTGDPPQIPHEVAATDSGEDCLMCHREGEAGAPVTPHPWLVDCQQCHIALEPGVAPFRSTIQ